LFEIEIAKNNRGSCRICNHLITNGTKRVKCNLGSGYYSNLYHLECFVNEYLDVIIELYAFAYSGDIKFPLCEDCGISNSTVVRTAVKENGEIVAKLLCDYCIRDYEK